jgi:hypothetical protein
MAKLCDRQRRQCGAVFYGLVAAEVTVSLIRSGVYSWRPVKVHQAKRAFHGRDTLTGIGFCLIFSWMDVEAARSASTSNTVRGRGELRARYWPQVDDAISGHRHDNARPS